MAGQLLGPEGLGIVFIGFVAYQLVLGLQRAVVTQPLIAQTAPLAALHRLPPSYSGLTVTLATGLAASLVLVVAGLAVGGDPGRAFLLFAPWVTGALVQEYWKAILFQEGH